MSTIQWPIDGKYGKDFKTTSSFGWRTHPITKNRKHHNGEDLWSSREPCYIEAMADGVVLKARKSTHPTGGFGYYVILQHKIAGQYYTSLYAHMRAGSLQVKPGQKVKAGDVLGKMGTTGHSTGKHLHWEIWKGKKHGWTANGKGFMDPVEFMKKFNGKESAAPAAAPQKPTTFKAPKTKPTKLSEYLNKGDRNVETAWVQYVLGLKVDGIFGSATHKAVRNFQKQNGLKADGIIGPLTWRKIPESKPESRHDGKIVKPALTSWLKKGSRGIDVKYLQQELGIKVDGIFGNATHQAVRDFQKKNRLKVDGIVGPVTWSKL